MTAERLIIWRHGRTEWNVTGQFQGQADVDIDQVGHRQAAAAAEVLAELGVDRIVASDLIRCRHTAGYLAERTGHQIELDPRLREIHVGSWQGLGPEYHTDARAAIARGEDVRRSDTGETTSEVAVRAEAAMREIAESSPDGSTVVLAMHGVSGKVGACRLVGLPFETWHGLGGLHNCAWIEVLHRPEHERWVIGSYNVQIPVPA